MSDKQVPSLGRQTFLDGHAVNESYKVPSAHPSGKDNLSYMHPHLKPLSIETPWKTADKALAEAHRPINQLSRSKTVAPVSSGKVRGAPPQPTYGRASRASSRAPALGVIPGPTKPPVF